MLRNENYDDLTYSIHLNIVWYLIWTEKWLDNYFKVRMMLCYVCDVLLSML